MVSRVARCVLIDRNGAIPPMKITNAVAVRLTFLVLCLWVAIGHWPPAMFAERQQTRVEIVPVNSTEDQLQDQSLKALEDKLNSHLSDTKETRTVTQARVSKLENDFAELHGEERALGALLVILQIVSIVQVLRKAK
jgi:hypothetical protein